MVAMGRAHAGWIGARRGPAGAPLLAAALAVAILAGACSTGTADRGEGAPAGPVRPTPESGGADDPAPPSTAEQPDRLPTPVLEPAPCPDPTTPTERISCHRLVRPEDPRAPDGRQVELPVLRIRPSGPPSGPPLVYLHGGPGGGSTRSWASWAAVADALGREVVLHDQRGAGEARPRLDCPEHTAALAAVLARERSWRRDRDQVAAALQRCHRRLSSSGVDLDRYDTPSAASDLEDLRVALGLGRLTLLGSSYGSRLALEYLRTRPDRVEAVVLDGVDPPGTGGPDRDRSVMEPAIDALVAACRADAVCSRDEPDLGTAIELAAARLDRRPRTVALPDGAGGAPGQVLVDGDALLAGVVAALYDAAVVPVLPSALRALASGRDELLDTVGARLGPALASVAMGATMSVNCADHGRRRPGDAADARADPGRSALVVLTGSDGFCDVWEVEPVGDDADEVPVAQAAEVPVLVVSGELDPITPARQGRRLAERLGAPHLLVPLGGHAPAVVDACAIDRVRRFLDSPREPVRACPPRGFRSGGPAR
jgi:pimeloyl-ACP methyl ester carboxylesterase